MKPWIILGFILFFLPLTYAWECEYGTAKAWVKLPGDTEWREALVDGVTLKVHEPFKVKVEVRTKTDMHILDLGIYDPGVTKVFEVVEGPSKNGGHILKYDVPANWTRTYEWTVRPTGKWTEAYGPLNFGVTFMKSQDDYRVIDKTIIHAYISPKEWKGETSESEKSSKPSTPSSKKTEGGEINLWIWIGVVVIVIIVLLAFFIRKRF